MPGPFASIIMAAFGVLGWLVAILVTVQRLRLLVRGVRATGTIVRQKVRSEPRPGSPSLVTYTPVVRVRDQATGKSFEFQSSFGSSATRLSYGQQVPVRYLPDDHTAAEIDRFLPMWFFPIGAATVGTLLLWSLWYLRFRGGA